MSDPILKVIDDKLYYGEGHLDWISFLSPITAYEIFIDNKDVKVTTEDGEYILCSINDPRYMRVIRIKGKSLKSVTL